MQCEKCGRETDVIRHIKIKNSVEHVFNFNNSNDAMICIECYNNRPEFFTEKYGSYLVETIRNAEE